MNDVLTQEMLKKLLHYDPSTGWFTWLVSPTLSVRIGQRAGTMSGKRKYVRIEIKGKMYKAHRLAWLYMNGSFPNGEIDHINRVLHDNRISNLRIATCSQNGMNKTLQKNNTSGHRGVVFNKASGKWIAKIRYKRNMIHIGIYANIKDAIAARRARAMELYGEFYNDDQVAAEENGRE